MNDGIFALAIFGSATAFVFSGDAGSIMGMVSAAVFVCAFLYQLSSRV